MNEKVINNSDKCYVLAEEKAEKYFESLRAQVNEKSYIDVLTKDIQSWKQNHIRHRSLASLFAHKNKKPTNKEYHQYISWLNKRGKLEQYLHRSISYIYLRDLGKALDKPETQTKIKQVVDTLISQLVTDKFEEASEFDLFSTHGLYRWGQKENIESSVIWLFDKLRIVSTSIPNGMDAENAQRKLIKIIGGVMMHVREEMDSDISPEERAQKLDEAIRLGYSYGLTYPFIDDLLDANVLSDEEKKQFSTIIRMTLINGTVPEIDEWSGENENLIRFIHSELKEAFEYIKGCQTPDNARIFFDQAYVFFHSQEVDRVKELTNEHYSNEELFIPIILKSSSSRLIVRSVISAPEDEGFNKRTFYYGIYNQLADDFADLFDDMDAGAVTPYTYYLTYHDKRPELINPFELYWTVIYNLIHHVYDSDPHACEVILDRAINGLKRNKERLGTKKYDELMKLLTANIPAFNSLIQTMVQKADDVDFFDKLLRDHILSNMRKDRQEESEFANTIKSIRQEVNQYLPINQLESTLLTNDPIIDAANYSLEGDGKRLRPIVTWMMGVREYGLDSTAIVPLLKSLEYMHTASLILDDLPSQDNAPFRRGRATLHKVHNTGIAEITSVYLIQNAMKEQASLKQFDAASVLQLIRYSSQVAMDMCRGQAMDLESKGKTLTLEELNTLSFYKTGIAFEASLIMPAILAQVEESEIEKLKKFAHHAGIAFQIKDDLLDLEGDDLLLGKPVGQDKENNNSTFVSVLGREGARKVMWDHYCYAMEAIVQISPKSSFLKHLLNYMVNRER